MGIAIYAVAKRPGEALVAAAFAGTAYLVNWHGGAADYGKLVATG